VAARRKKFWWREALSKLPARLQVAVVREHLDTTKRLLRTLHPEEGKALVRQIATSYPVGDSVDVTPVRAAYAMLEARIEVEGSELRAPWALVASDMAVSLRARVTLAMKRSRLPDEVRLRTPAPWQAEFDAAAASMEQLALTAAQEQRAERPRAGSDQE